MENSYSDIRQFVIDFGVATSKVKALASLLEGHKCKNLMRYLNTGEDNQLKTDFISQVASIRDPDVIAIILQLEPLVAEELEEFEEEPYRRAFYNALYEPLAVFRDDIYHLIISDLQDADSEIRQKAIRLLNSCEFYIQPSIIRTDHEVTDIFLSVLQDQSAKVRNWGLGALRSFVRARAKITVRFANSEVACAVLCGNSTRHGIDHTPN